MIHKCVVGCRFNYHGEQQFLIFLFQQNIELSRVREQDFLKIGNQALLYLLFISATLKTSFFLNGKKVERTRLITLLKPVLSISICSAATLLKLTLLHGCFPRFLNCTNGTKSRNASHICGSRKIDIF